MNLLQNLPQNKKLYPDECTLGSIFLRKGQQTWIVIWPWKGKKYKIAQYNGWTMYKSHSDKKKDRGYQQARKLRALMQADVERGVFRVEKYLNKNWTDIMEFYRQWLDEVIVPGRKPATIKGYKSYGKNWIGPFFSTKKIMLHEVKADTLQSFLNYIVSGLKKKKLKKTPDTELIIKLYKKNSLLSAAEINRIINKRYGIKLSGSWVRRVIAKVRAGSEIVTENKNIGKTAINILYAFHSMMDYALRTCRIKSIPPFPKRENFPLAPRKIEYLSPEEFDCVLSKIHPAHIPIFRWLKFHFRRPGEACAIKKSDYDPVNESFLIHRAISARQLVDSVKTNWKNQRCHLIDCDPEFVATANRLLRENQDSPFLFVNRNARKEGKRYTLESLRNIWYAACDDAGIKKIWTYRGTKHTACMEFLENGGTDDELMILTDHANRESVKAYREITLNRKRQARAAAKERAAKRKKIIFNNKTPGNVISLF